MMADRRGNHRFDADWKLSFGDGAGQDHVAEISIADHDRDNDDRLLAVLAEGFGIRR
jgi:hypothetical protein